MGCDSIATTISRMGKEPTTLGPEDLKGHRFSAFWLRSSVVSVLIGHVFGFSAENVNSSRSCVSIALLLVSFASFYCGDSICEVCFCVVGLFSTILSGFVSRRQTRALRDDCAAPRNLRAHKNCASHC